MSRLHRFLLKFPIQNSKISLIFSCFVKTNHKIVGAPQPLEFVRKIKYECRIATPSMRRAGLLLIALGYACANELWTTAHLTRPFFTCCQQHHAHDERLQKACVWVRHTTLISDRRRCKFSIVGSADLATRASSYCLSK